MTDHTTIKHVIYLHGLASSPGSTKANILADRLRPFEHVQFHVPDLNVPTFETLTLSAMIGKTADTVDQCSEGPVYLIGSSLGGLTAVHFLDQHRQRIAKRVEKVILMAPALDFMNNRVSQLGEDGLKQWRESGTLKMQHYATNQVHEVHYGLVEDIMKYDSYNVNFDQPTTIFHGRNDASVDYRQSVRFAEQYPNVELFLSDSDHNLYDQLDVIWLHIQRFFGLA